MNPKYLHNQIDKLRSILEASLKSFGIEPFWETTPTAFEQALDMEWRKQHSEVRSRC